VVVNTMVNWDSIKSILKKHKRFLITSHVCPEGDALGSSVALKLFLQSMKKEAHLINEGKSASQLDFLNHGHFRVFNADSIEDQKFIASFPVLFVVDVSDWGHMGILGERLRVLDSIKICIDHHPPKGKFGDYDLIDRTASATGQLIYQMIKHFKGKITPEIATALYTSIITDTGQFAFPNTTPQVIQIAADLVKQGVNHYDVYQKVYENNNWSKLFLMEKALKSLHADANKQIAWMKITQDMFKELNAPFDDAEGFVDQLRAIHGVKIAMLFRELPGEQVRINLRSKEGVNVSELAKSIGGGGHPNASGALCHGKLDDVIEKVVAKARELLNSH